MANPVEAWHQDHVHFLELLALLQREIDAFQSGATPDYQLMLDIVAYLRAYSDQCHHPREDEAFRRLLRYRPDRALPIARLLQEHRVIAHAGEVLRELLESARSDAMLARAEIEAAAATYLVYYRGHIAREEEDVLPRTTQLLTPADWAAVRDAALEANDPVFGAASGSQFGALRRSLEAQAA
jgi:hemerythrin-like domain-containing protein